VYIISSSKLKLIKYRR